MFKDKEIHWAINDTLRFMLFKAKGNLRGSQFRGVFRAQPRIYDGAFLQKYLMAANRQLFSQ